MTPAQAPQAEKTILSQPTLTQAEKRSLRRSTYRSRTFERVDFAGADFRLSRFTSVTFLQCDLSGADLRGVQFDGCQFIDCDLASLKLGHNRFGDTDFRNCHRLLLEQRRLVLSMGARWIESLRE